MQQCCKNKFCFYLFAVVYLCNKAENMTHTINISANFTATVTVSDSCVVITTNYFNTKRSSSFDRVADAIKNTSIPAVAKLLSSI